MSARRRRGVAARVAVACAAIATLLVGAGARPAPAQRDVASLRLASQTPWVEAGETFGLRLQVAGVPRPDRVQVTVQVHQRVGSRSQFVQTNGGERLGGVLARASKPLDEYYPTDPGGAIYQSFSPAQLALSRTGVYPVSVVLREGRTVLQRLVTHLLYVDAPVTTPRLGVSWVVRLHLPPGVGPSGRPRSRDVAGLAALADTVSSPPYRDLPLVLAPTPEALDTLSRPGDELREALDDVRAATESRQVLAPPSVPVAVSALEDLGLDRELPEQRVRGVDTVSSVLGVRPDTSTWLGEDPLDEPSLTRLRELQVERVVVREGDLEPISQSLTLAQPFSVEARTGRTLGAVVADTGLAAHFDDGGDQVLAAHRLLADLATIWLDAPQRPRGVVVVTPREWSPTRAFLAAALDGMGESPVLEAMSLDTLFDRVPAATHTAARGRTTPMVRRMAAQSAPSLGVSPSRLRAARADVDALASTLPPASPRHAAVTRLLLLAAGADLTPAQRRAYLRGTEAALRRTVDSLVLPSERTFTLTAREGFIPLTFDNRTGAALRVVVRVRSDRLDLRGLSGTDERCVVAPASRPGRPEAECELAPGPQTVRVNVRARDSGVSPIEVSVLSRRGGLELKEARFSVRSTAASGVGVALSAAAGAFLLLWWGRHLRRGRRSRGLVPA